MEVRIMKSKILIYGFVALLILLAFSIAPVAAKKPVDAGKPEMTGVLKLVQKNETDWSIVDGGAHGNFNGALFKSKIIFNAEGLAPKTSYALISYKEPWNGVGSIVIATGKSSAAGKLQIKGVDLKNKLVYNDYTGYTTGDYIDVKGAKVWLVPTSDLSATVIGGETSFIAWNPSTYLFETRLIPQP
jgi:hypothetical protein